MRSSSRPLSGVGSAAFCRFWGRRSWPSTARPAAARAESTPPRCTWFRRLRPGRDWCWGNGPRRRSPTRSRPFPNCSRRLRWLVVPSPSTPWAHKPPSPRSFRSAAPTTSWRSKTTSPNWPRRSRTFGAAFAPTPQPTPRTRLPKPWTRTMAAWRRAAATCSINWNASINPSSGRGCAASPCWNRNAGSATKPPTNNASTSAVWLPMRPASPAPSVPTGPSRTGCSLLLDAKRKIQNYVLTLIAPEEVYFRQQNRLAFRPPVRPHHLNLGLEFAFWGYLLHATERNRLWFDQGCKRGRIYLHSLLGQAIEQFAARGRGTTVESKGELVEVIVQVVVSDCTLMGAEQPSLQQRDHAMHARQQLRRGFLLPA